jgi:hypothetical protein
MAKPVKKRSGPNRIRPETIRVMATASEKAEMRKAAALAAVPLSVWLRSVGLTAARRLTKG